ncbi:hypothetical protein cypCar_00022904 [Cyprinus carpio]|nr:hypothetical protein cypCar_00022904 [Cyprinus carpio]
MTQIMQHHGCRSHMRDRNRLTGLEDRFDLVVDSNDAILEKVGILLDEASGVSRTQQPVMPAGYQPPKIVVSSWNRRGGERRDETFHLLHAKNIQRPQLKFKEKVDNSNTPFVSKIFIKPNAVKPLPSYFAHKHIRKEGRRILDCSCCYWLILSSSAREHKVWRHVFHPYQYELRSSESCRRSEEVINLNVQMTFVALNEKFSQRCLSFAVLTGGMDGNHAIHDAVFITLVFNMSKFSVNSIIPTELSGNYPV